MSRKRLMKEMDAKEVLMWMSYEMTVDRDTRERLQNEIALEAAENQTSEEEARLVKALLTGLGGNT